MMKKNRNIRKRADSDEEPEKTNVIPFLEEDYHAQIRDIQKVQKDRTEKKKKKKEKSKEENKKSILSFDHDEHDEEGEVFQIKKSTYSKKMAKKARDRQKQLKKEEEHPTPAGQITGKVEAKPETKLAKSASTGDVKPMILAGQAAEAMAREQEDKQELSGERFPSLAPGMIPDAAMIHAARKRRQRAREQGDYIPLDDTRRFENEGSRIVREDDNDKSGSDSGDDEERMSFTVKQTSNRQRVREALDRKAQESDEASGDEHDEEMLRWEQEQIKKGTVNVPQAVVSESTVTQESPYDYQQYLYGQTQAPEYGYATSVSSLPVGGGYSIGRGEVGTAEVVAPSATSVPTVLPTVNMEQVKKKLKERLESIQEVHRAHEREQDGMGDRLSSSASSTIHLKDTQGDVSGQYGFFQEMRGYVRDLVECLNEKLPDINSMETSMHLLLKNRAQQLVERRQADIRDQSSEYTGAMMRAAAAPNLDASRGSTGMLDDATQRRAAEREARRARRRRAREGRKQDKSHYEGMSSDDELIVSHVQRITTEKDRIMTQSSSLFEDVVEDFHALSIIQSRFQKWKMTHGETYQDAYIGLCLPKLCAPYVRLQLLDWNPLKAKCPELEDMRWYESLLFYGFSDIDGMDPEDPDIKLLPSLVEKVVVPKLTYLVENVWDPCSASQTHRLVTLVQRLAEDYPTVSARNKNTQGLLEALVLRMRKTLDDDVFMPLFPKSMIENKKEGPYQFLQRQFWACVKLLGNLLLWHGVVAGDPLRELALDGLLNRYLLLSLQNSDVNDDSIGKSQMIVSTFPAGWFKDLEGDSTIRQLEPFCRYQVQSAGKLNQVAMAASDLKEKQAKNGIKLITKMLVNLHAMDHALSLSQDFSLKDMKEMVQKL